MADQTCPKCGGQFPASDTLAKAAVSLLVPAPAVRDMATQVRCPHCHHLFADSEVRHLATSQSKIPRLLVAVACLSLVAWAVYELF
jgi:hypothetical protein